MTFNIQHGLDYKRRDKASLKAFDEMKPEYLKKLRETKPADRKQEDPSLIDLSLTVNAVRACGAEILTLNEVRDTEEGVSDPCFTPQVQRIAEGLGWPYFYFGKAIRIEGKGLYGNGIVSRYPFLDVETIPIPDPEVQDEPTYYESRCVIKARIDVKGRPLTVLTTHMGLASSEARGAVCTIIHLATSNMAFGGVGESGMGSYHGRKGFDTFTHEKSIVDKKTWLDLPIRYQRYTRLKEALLKLFLR